MQENQIRHQVIFLDKHLDAWEGWAKNQSVSSIFVVVDENTKQHSWPLVAHFPLFDQAHLIQIPAGERYKNLDTTKTIWSELMNLGADRNSLVIGLGGGVVTDMAGFAASTFKRGMRIVHFPTSLMGMVDAAIGGKTGIDFKGAKNQIGTFAQPEKVFVFPPFLGSLPEEEMKSGYAEMIKYGLTTNAKFFEILKERNGWTVDHDDLVFSAHTKLRIVESDPFETGERAVLNFGHTAGHALESHFLKLNRPVSHGFAVAMGMMVELELSTSIGLDPEKAQNAITFLNQKYPRKPLTRQDLSSIVSHLKDDKKNQSGQMNFVLLEDIGKPKIKQVVTQEGVLLAMVNQWL